MKTDKTTTTTGINHTTSIDLKVNMVDEDKISELILKREKLIFNMDRVKMEHCRIMNSLRMDYFKSINKINRQIEKARKGKTIKRKLKKNAR